MRSMEVKAFVSLVEQRQIVILSLHKEQRIQAKAALILAESMTRSRAETLASFIPVTKIVREKTDITQVVLGNEPNISQFVGKNYIYWVDHPILRENTQGKIQLFSSEEKFTFIDETALMEASTFAPKKQNAPREVDSFVVERLIEEGAVLVGKFNSRVAREVLSSRLSLELGAEKARKLAQRVEYVHLRDFTGQRAAISVSGFKDEDNLPATTTIYILTEKKGDFAEKKAPSDAEKGESTEENSLWYEWLDIFKPSELLELKQKRLIRDRENFQNTKMHFASEKNQIKLSQKKSRNKYLNTPRVLTVALLISMSFILYLLIFH